jgi:hypothetical protein
MRQEGWCAHCQLPSRGQFSTVYARSVVSRACEVSGIARTEIVDTQHDHNAFERLVDS